MTPVGEMAPGRKKTKRQLTKADRTRCHDLSVSSNGRLEIS